MVSGGDAGEVAAGVSAGAGSTAGPKGTVCSTVVERCSTERGTGEAGRRWAYPTNTAVSNMLVIPASAMAGRRRSGLLLAVKRREGADGAAGANDSAGTTSNSTGGTSESG